MRQLFLNLSFLLAAVLLVGCEETTTETSQEAPAEITARLCHIARIGNLAEIPDELWDDEKKPESQGLPAGLDFSGKMKEAPTSKAVGKEVDPDILAIVESTAKESTSQKEIEKAKEKEEELDLAIEMVNENQKMDSEVEKMFSKDGEKASKTKDGEEDEDEEVAISMDGKKEVEAEEEIKILDENGDEEDEAEEMADSEETDVTEETAEEATEEKSEEKTEEKAEEKEEKVSEAEKKAEPKSGDFAEEVERQAEAFLDVLKNTPKEVREEMQKAHFQNVTYRLVKVPSQIVQEIPEECFIIRTMEYTGSNLSHDFQVLNLSPNYSAWLLKQEKYLEIITLDSMHHENWVEVPEFWNSGNE